MIKDLTKVCVFLSSIEIQYKKASEIINVNNPLKFFDDLKNNEFIKKQLGASYEKALTRLKSFNYERFLQYCDTHNIKFVTAYDSAFPEDMFSLDYPPLVLYYKGDFSLINTTTVAIVGTRKPSFYGKEITENFSRTLSKHGVTIVSGLAAGVDSIAHECCLAENGKTIAVLGNGFMNMYPAMNEHLAEKIAENGLIITEYHPAFKATTYSFPTRNRIIACISKGVLITEAGKKSGSLHTKNYALELGRDIFAIPGNITSVNSYGTNILIRSGQCECVLKPEDIVERYNIAFSANKIKKSVILDIDDLTITKLLEDGEKSFDFLQEKTKLSTQTLNSRLTTLQIRGIIKKLPGNFYSV